MHTRSAWNKEEAPGNDVEHYCTAMMHGLRSHWCADKYLSDSVITDLGLGLQSKGLLQLSTMMH
eukprot:scaffold187813_cov80-Cyclotella_meneghiniana.AAC.2